MALAASVIERRLEEITVGSAIEVYRRKSSVCPGGWYTGKVIKIADKIWHTKGATSRNYTIQYESDASHGKGKGNAKETHDLFAVHWKKPTSSAPSVDLTTSTCSSTTARFRLKV